MVQPAAGIGDSFAKAMKAYESGKAQTARKLATRLAEDHPGFGGGHYLLGLLALERRHCRQAISHFARAIAITPDQPAPHFAMGRALEASDDINSAMLHYRAVLTHDPRHAEAHARLGDLLRRSGKIDQAIEHCRATLAVLPDHAEAHHCLGALLLEQGEAEQALPHLKQALAARPDWPAALNNTALALHRLGRLDEAAVLAAGAIELAPDRAGFRANLAAIHRAAGRLDQARIEAETATRRDPHCADGWIELGLARQAMGHIEGAAAAFERAVTAAPDLPRAHWCLAEAAMAQGQTERAARHYRACLELDAEDRFGAALRLSLATGGATPDKAPTAYVRQLFDDYADRFDTQLMERLDYRAPAVLGAALARSLGSAVDLDVIDIGCGTGLAAPMLRPLARRLIGIDLSAAMAAKARQRGLYDEVAVGELEARLHAEPLAYDLVVAADVLVYFGDLGGVTAAAHCALKPGGAFAFTVERAGDDVASYALGAKSRYAHAGPYLRALADQYGFTVALLEPAATRRDDGADVPGWVAVLKKRG